MENRRSRDYLKDDKSKLLNRAWGWSHLSMHKDAVRECENLVRLDENDAESYIELGYYYEKDGEIDKAKECYRKAMERFPDYYGSYTNMGYYFAVYKKRPDIAMVLYEKALELNPEEPWALNNIGTILQDQGNWPEALNYYEKACKFREGDDEKNYAIFHNLAWAYYKCKEYEKAWNIFIYLIKKYDNKHDIYSDFGCLNYKIGNYSNALQLFEKALSLCPESRYYKRLYRMSYKKINNK